MFLVHKSRWRNPLVNSGSVTFLTSGADAWQAGKEAMIDRYADSKKNSIRDKVGSITLITLTFTGESIHSAASESVIAGVCMGAQGREEQVTPA